MTIPSFTNQTELNIFLFQTEEKFRKEHPQKMDFWICVNVVNFPSLDEGFHKMDEETFIQKKQEIIKCCHNSFKSFCVEDESQATNETRVRVFIKENENDENDIFNSFVAVEFSN
jgi:hypothetical protein